MSEVHSERTRAAIYNEQFGEEIVPIVRPTWRQLAVFVSDASISMKDPYGGGEGAKADAVAAAIHGTLSDLHKSSMKESFHYASVTFHDKARTAVAATEVAKFSPETPKAQFDPTASGVGGTEIHTGLNEARAIANSFVGDTSSGLPSSAVILLLSDGECYSPDATVRAAAELKELGFTVACVLFSDGMKGEATLQACASGANFYLRTYDAAAVRDFFNKTIKSTVGKR